MTKIQASAKGEPGNGGATIGYESELWAMADALRGSMDASEYKHVALGLIFLKYVSDAFEEMRRLLESERDQGADPEHPDEYRAENVFWVPPEARWMKLQTNAPQPDIGELVDAAMTAIEKDNPVLRNVLPKDYARPALDKRRLGQLINLISNISVGDQEARSKDVLGRVYEYFLSQFAGAEGKKGGEFYTARSVVKLLVAMLRPYRGRVYDPCCGSSGMFVQSMEFIEAHATGNGNGGLAGADISIYGQESNYTTWRLARMNLAIRGIEGQIAHGDTFHDDRHPDLKADYILANPPFNISDWGQEGLREDKRWKYGVPPAGNANFAWVQHMIHHLAPRGVAGFVLANGSMSSKTSGEGKIRAAIVEDDLVDCMVALPGQLFYSTQIPVCLWFLARDRAGGEHRNRTGETLFIDARKLGRMVDRTHRELSDEDIARIADTYHNWRSKEPSSKYADVPGFCKSATLEEVRRHDHILTPGRYVGFEPPEEDSEPFEEKMARLTAQWREQQKEASRLDAAIEANLAGLGFGPPGDDTWLYHHMTRMFNDCIFPVLDRFHRLDEASSALTALRDTLLPKLVSGEVRVDHAILGETCRS
ncbi:MAG: SAM-dependent DNA methyltransferase [Acidimicrobiia bacterium]|nr:SAM-dependent DNA methyltransferase [Acidimicrobiia bacterium]